MCTQREKLPSDFESCVVSNSSIFKQCCKAAKLESSKTENKLSEHNLQSARQFLQSKAPESLFKPQLLLL